MWICDDLLPGFDTFGFREPAAKWQLAASVIASLLCLLDDYDPVLCNAGEGAEVESPHMMHKILVPQYRSADDSHHQLAHEFGQTESLPSLETYPCSASGEAKMGGTGPGATGTGTGPGTGGGNDVCAKDRKGKGVPVGYTLSPLPPELLLHCAFHMPRSPLLQRLHRILAAATTVLCGDSHAGLIDESADPSVGSGVDVRKTTAATSAGSAAAGAGAASGVSSGGDDGGFHDAERVLVYHTAALVLRLLNALVSAEAYVRDKLRRLKSSQARIASWHCWGDSQRQTLKALYAEQWRSMPPLRVGGSFLATCLVHPMLYSMTLTAESTNVAECGTVGFNAAGTLCSPIGSILHILQATTSELPPVATRVVALASLSLMRQVSSALGDAFGTLLRAEGLLPVARQAMLALLHGAADAEGANRATGTSSTDYHVDLSSVHQEEEGVRAAARGIYELLARAAGSGNLFPSEDDLVSCMLSSGSARGNDAFCMVQLSSAKADVVALPSVPVEHDSALLSNTRAYESPALWCTPSAQVLLFLLDDLGAATTLVQPVGAASSADSPATSAHERFGRSSGRTALDLLGLDVSAANLVPHGDARLEPSTVRAGALLQVLLLLSKPGHIRKAAPETGDVRGDARLASSPFLRELSASLICRLVSDGRTSELLLRMLVSRGYHAALVAALPAQLTRLQKYVAASPQGSGSDQAALCAGSAGGVACATLHAMGHTMHHLALALHRMLRASQCSPHYERDAASAALRSAFHASDDSRARLTEAEPLGVGSALPLFALLLPHPLTTCPESNTTSTGAERPVSHNVVAHSLPLALCIHGVYDAVVTAARAANQCAVDSSWPMVTQARGSGVVELVDIRTLHQRLIGAAVSRAGRTEPNRQSSFLNAVALNSAQARLHAALHALASCRQLLGLLPVAAYADRRIAPRLSLLSSILSLLSPPQKAYPSRAVEELTPTLAIAALATLRSLGPRWRASSEVQLELLSLTLNALLPPMSLPNKARVPLYLTLLSLLAPCEAAHGMPALAHVYYELHARVHAVVSGNCGALLPLLCLDASEGPPAARAAAITLLAVLLPLQPFAGAASTPRTASLHDSDIGHVRAGGVGVGSDALGANAGVWTSQLCGCGILGSLTSSFGRIDAPMVADVQSLLTLVDPPRRAHASLWVYECTAALLLQVIRCSSAGALMLFSTGALNNLVSSLHLDLTASYLAQRRPHEAHNRGRVWMRDDAARAALHQRLMLGTLRVVSAAAAAGLAVAPAATSALLTCFLLRDDARVAAMVATLRAPIRSFTMATGGETGESTTFPSTELQVSSLLLQQLLMLLHGSTTAASGSMTTAAVPRTAAKELRARAGGSGRGAFAVSSATECTPRVLPAALLRRYTASVLQLVPCLVWWLPAPGSSRAAYLADAVRDAVNMRPDSSRRGSVRYADTDDQAKPCDLETVARTWGEHSAVAVLCRSLAVIAHHSACVSPMLATGSIVDGATEPLSFSPDLSSTCSSVIGATPPLGLVGTIIRWALDELHSIDRAHAACSAATRALPTMNASSLRSLHVVLSEELPTSHGGGSRGPVDVDITKRRGNAGATLGLRSQILEAPEGVSTSELTSTASALVETALGVFAERSACTIRLLEYCLLILTTHLRAFLPVTNQPKPSNYQAFVMSPAGLDSATSRVRTAFDAKERREFLIAAQRPLPPLRKEKGDRCDLSLAAVLKKVAACAPVALSGASKQLRLARLLAERASAMLAE